MLCYDSWLTVSWSSSRKKTDLQPRSCKKDLCLSWKMLGCFSSLYWLFCEVAWHKEGECDQEHVLEAFTHVAIIFITSKCMYLIFYQLDKKIFFFPSNSSIVSQKSSFPILFSVICYFLPILVLAEYSIKTWDVVWLSSSSSYWRSNTSEHTNSRVKQLIFHCLIALHTWRLGAVKQRGRMQLVRSIQHH